MIPTLLCRLRHSHLLACFYDPYRIVMIFSVYGASLAPSCRHFTAFYFAHLANHLPSLHCLPSTMPLPHTPPSPRLLTHQRHATMEQRSVKQHRLPRCGNLCDRPYLPTILNGLFRCICQPTMLPWHANAAIILLLFFWCTFLLLLALLTSLCFPAWAYGRRGARHRPACCSLHA